MSNKQPKQELRRLKKELGTFEAPIIRDYLTTERWSGTQVGYQVSRMTEIQQAANRAVADMITPPANTATETINTMYAEPQQTTAQVVNIEEIRQRIAGIQRMQDAA